MEREIRQEDVSSDLIIVDFYFSEITFKNERIFGDSAVKISYSLDNQKLENGNVKVEVTTKVAGEGQGIFLQLKAVGIFDATAVVESDKKEFMEQIATVTAMMPYIRTQVTLLTTQPGLSQLILPPVNVYKLVDIK